jgi:hypothetical protein
MSTDNVTADIGHRSGKIQPSYFQGVPGMFPFCPIKDGLIHVISRRRFSYQSLKEKK